MSLEQLDHYISDIAFAFPVGLHQGGFARIEINCSLGQVFAVLAELARDVVDDR